MADWGSALTGQLLANVPLQTLLGADAQNIDWSTRPAGGRGITLETTSDPRPDHFRGEQSFRRTRVQADCWSNVSADDAVKIAEAVIAAVRLDPGVSGADASGSWERDGVRFDRPQIEGPEDGFERVDTVVIYRARLDLLLWHSELEV